MAHYDSRTKKLTSFLDVFKTLTRVTAQEVLMALYFDKKKRTSTKIYYYLDEKELR